MGMPAGVQLTAATSDPPGTVLLGASQANPRRAERTAVALAVVTAAVTATPALAAFGAAQLSSHGLADTGASAATAAARVVPSPVPSPGQPLWRPPAAPWSTAEGLL